MLTINLSDLPPHSYVKHNGQIISIKEAEAKIAKGDQPELYVLSDILIQNALLETSRELLKEGNASDSYSGPEPPAILIMY